MDGKLSSAPRTTYDARLGSGLSRGPSMRAKLKAAAWSQTWPAPGSTLDLDFANNRGWVRGYGQGGVMDAITFTRASNGTYVGSNGVLASATNTIPRFDWASTASTGAGTIADPRIIPLAANPTSNGILIEEARTNSLLWCRDATNAAWTKTTMTAALDQTGIDGVANAASSLTATSANATCIQTVTAASASRTGSVYLKRITGTGTVQVSLDGTTWSTVALNSTEWRRIVLSGTVTNPVVGIKLATSGDAVTMDYGQIEAGAFATSPIYTDTATATRSADIATLQDSRTTPLALAAGAVAFSAISYRPAGAVGTFVNLWQSNAALMGINQVANAANRLGLNYTGFTQLQINGSPTAVGGFAPFERFKAAASFGRGPVNLFCNGNASIVATTGGMAAGGVNYTIMPSRIYFGLDPNGATYINGCLDRVTMFASTASPAMLAAWSGPAT